MNEATPALDAPARGSRHPGPPWWSDAPAMQAPPAALDDIYAFLQRLAGETMLLTSAYEGCRAGSFVYWAHQCARKPPMIAVAFPRGLRVARVIYESRIFALCRIAAGDPVLTRRFDESVDPGHDPFLGLGEQTAPAGSPVPRRVTSWIECEIAFNLDLDADCGLYVGRIVAAGRVAEREGVLSDASDHRVSTNRQSAHTGPAGPLDRGASDACPSVSLPNGEGTNPPQ